MNGVIKSGLRKFLGQFDGGRWWEFLPDVVRACRILPAAATQLPPYLLVFKMSPEVPVHSDIRIVADNECIERAEEGIEQQTRFWAELNAEVSRRILAFDKTTLRNYLRRKDLADHDVRFVFAPGD